MLLGLAGPAHAIVYFTESFESPVVSGYVQNSVPDTGWVGATQGFGATSRGLYHEGDGVFTTPFGDQAYLLDYTNAGLTTAQATVPASLMAGVTYTVSFNAAIRSTDTSANYQVEFVAFDPGDDDAARTECRGGRPGTILDSATGTVSTSDMSASDSIIYTPAAGDPSLGKEIGVRLIKNSGDMLYDNVVLADDTTGDVNPPAVLSLSPKDDSTWVWTGTNLGMTFNEAVQPGSGNIVIRDSSNDAVVETMGVTSGNVTFTSPSVTIDPSNNLAEGAGYYVHIDSGAIKDAAGNDFAGFSDNSTWNFTTTEPDGPRTIFSESFESPVVSGYAANTVPDTGWVGATQGHRANWRGLYNEGDGSVFTTAFGEQAYLLDYTNSGLTTDEATITDVLTAGVTYTLKFNVAVREGESGSYRVELVAFDLGDDDAARTECRRNLRPGTILAFATGDVTTSDMWANGGIVFTPDSSDPSLGKQLGIRLIKSGGDMLYDNIKLTDNSLADVIPEPATLSLLGLGALLALRRRRKA